MASNAVDRYYQGKNIGLPECLGQVNFDCGHADFCCTGLAGMYFLLSFSIKNFTNHTHLCILPGNCKVWACNFCNGTGNFFRAPVHWTGMFQVMFLP